MPDLDLSALNSATKYPSIPTYHELDPKNGRLIDGSCQQFTGPVILTEKIDGTNGRIVVLPGGDWFIGSREELLYAKGDRIVNPALGIVPALLPLAGQLGMSDLTKPMAFFLEVYGKGIGAAAGNYSSKGISGITGYRMFDVAVIDPDVLSWPREKISAWREHGGQEFLSEDQLQKLASWEHTILAPRLGAVDAAELPSSLNGMRAFLDGYLPTSLAVLDDVASGRPEGIVLRAQNRSVIAKARFQDYNRTLNRK